MMDLIEEREVWRLSLELQVAPANSLEKAGNEERRRTLRHA